MVPLKDLRTFKTGFVQDRDTIWVVNQIDEIAEAGGDDSALSRVTLSTNARAGLDVEWGGVRAALGAQLPILMLGIGGEIIEVTPGSGRPHPESKIDDGPEGPQFRGPMRDIRWIGSHFFAAGMARQVYRRDTPGSWSRVDAGTVLPLGTKTVGGFNSIDGLSEDDIFAVGFGGEIWRRQKGKWRKLDSPSNVVLSRVRVVRPDLIYAVGQQGVLLEGRGDAWKIIEQAATSDDFWGLEWFREQLYIASEDCIYLLTAAGDLQEVDTGESEEDRTHYDLHANDGILLSVGQKTLLWTDGVTWHEVL